MANGKKVICGIQQVGIGVASVADSWSWYRRYFGVDIKILGDEGVAERMLPYTGGKPQPRYAVLAVNLRGGSGFEIWEPRGRKLKYLQEEALLGDYGILVCKVKCPDADAAYRRFREMDARLLTPVTVSPAGKRHFYLKDPWNNLFEVVEDDYVFVRERKVTGGGNGAVLGVSDMDRSIHFYGKLMEFDRIISDETGVFDDLKGVPGGERRFRRVLLGRSRPIQGPLCEVMGTGYIELLQCLDAEPKKLYEGRFWGDPGFIHLCFDVRNMAAVKADCEALGHPFVCDSGADFGMGDADGHFTYIEDPDGTLIEFVETFKIPVLKKWGIYLNLKNRDDYKPVPRWITKSLRFLRVKE